VEAVVRKIDHEELEHPQQGGENGVGSARTVIRFESDVLHSLEQLLHRPSFRHGDNRSRVRARLLFLCNWFNFENFPKQIFAQWMMSHHRKLEPPLQKLQSVLSTSTRNPLRREPGTNEQQPYESTRKQLFECFGLDMCTCSSVRSR
jgi:hypothetical protein